MVKFTGEFFLRGIMITLSVVIIFVMMSFDNIYVSFHVIIITAY